MRTRSIALASLIVFAFGIAADLPGNCVSSKSTAHKKSIRKRRARNYFVPPPPPVVLPSSWSGSSRGIYEAAKPANPYKKYVYCKEGYEDPAPVKVNKHVTYWNIQ